MGRRPDVARYPTRPGDAPFYYIFPLFRLSIPLFFQRFLFFLAPLLIRTLLSFSFRFRSVCSTIFLSTAFFLFVFFTSLLPFFFFSIRFLVCNFESYRLVIISELLVRKFFRTNSCSFHVQRYTKYSKYGVLCNSY